ncbi:MAG TPA: electron transfer flavoprotein subunit beta/FixA family protein [Actinomycetota bacterium]|nr:electron transfer flavoprotein subunit beta/FixA family protein [Actinomycetota bacterium]
MNVVVLAKYVPSPNGTPTLGEDHLLVREGVEGSLDPGDEPAIEAALEVVEKSGGEVTVVSMGPEVAMEAVRKALSVGVHKGVLVTDDALRGADTLATAQVLSTAIQLQDFDLVFAAVESTDGYSGTLPQLLAEFLGIPALTFARKVEVTDQGVRIERQTEGGYQVVESPLPALVTVTAGATTPRYPTLKGIMQAKQKPVERHGIGDLGLTEEGVRPTQTVAKVEDAPEREAGEIIEDDGNAAARIVEFLKEAKVV